MTKENQPLPDALSATRLEHRTEDGLRLAYYVDKAVEGRPLVLLHSINATASSIEMRPLFEAYRARRPVYSLDLPGFGHSDRPAIEYTPEVFAQAIRELLTNVVGEPADVVALSLTSELAARAAISAPGSVASLVIISPTGFGKEARAGTGVSSSIVRPLRLPFVGQRLFDMVASRRSIGFFLGQCFVGEPPEDLIAYAYASAHQPGARHAPLTFLSQRLFTADAMASLYAPLGEMRVLAIADQDPFVNFDQLDPFVLDHPSWNRIKLAPNRGLPHWEKPDDTVSSLDQFWAS